MIWKDYNTMKDDFNVEWIRIGSTHCWDLPDYKKKAEDLNPISDLNQLKSDLSHLNRFQSPGPFVDGSLEADCPLPSSCVGMKSTPSMHMVR